MPEKATIQRARKDLRKGKSASTAAGEFVREEIHHVREGKHGARSTEQAIAIGLSKARRAGVPLEPPAPGRTSRRTRRAAQRDVARGRSRKKTGTSTASPRRRKAARTALEREPKRAASRRALSKHAKRTAAARTRGRKRATRRRATRGRLGPRVRNSDESRCHALRPSPRSALTATHCRFEKSHGHSSHS